MYFQTRQLTLLTLTVVVVVAAFENGSNDHNALNCCVCNKKSGQLESISCNSNSQILNNQNETAHHENEQLVYTDYDQIMVIGGGGDGSNESCETVFFKLFNLSHQTIKNGDDGGGGDSKFLDFLLLTQNNDDDQKKMDCRQINDKLWSKVSPTSSGRVDYIKLVLTLYSIALLSFTVAIYIYLPSLRNVHGKAVICHLVSMGAVFGLQILQQFHHQLGSHLETGKKFPSLCWIVGFSLYFFNLAANAWLSIINFDIWTTFKKSCRRFDSEQVSRRFCIYSLMGWGGPGILSAILLILDNTLPACSYWRPGISMNHCFLPVIESCSMAIYFYGPIGTLLLFNVIIFIWTNLSLCVTQSETSRVNINRHKQLNQLMARLFLFFKLTCVMGSTFSINLGLWLSGYHLHQEKSLPGRLIELANVSHGFCYFLVFVCKGSVFKLVKKKFQLGSTTTRGHRSTSVGRRGTLNSSRLVSGTTHTESTRSVLPSSVFSSSEITVNK